MFKSWAADSCSGFFFVRCIYLYAFLFLLYFTFYRLFKRKLRFTLHSSQKCGIYLNTNELGA